MSAPGALAAVLLAAGESTRMGVPKLSLPWGASTTLIGHMLRLFQQAGLERVVVVTGGDREAVEAALQGSAAQRVHNPGYRSGGMLSSIKVGLNWLTSEEQAAAMLTPADLPFLRAATIQALIQRWQRDSPALLAPSYKRRRGHPVLVARPLWPQILELPADRSLRDFLRARAEEIAYLEVDDPGVLRDLDTPEDYQHARPA